jgi:hypothetical protein
MNRSIVYAAVLAAFIFCSCSKNQPESDNRHATVTLQDGTKIAGDVVKSSEKDITVIGKDKITHTIPTAQVRDIKYSDMAAGKKTPADTKTQPAQSKPAQNANPVQNVVYEVPAGSSIDVRAEETIDSSVATAGKVFDGSIAKDVSDRAGHIVIPRGSRAEILILSASKGGNIRGASDLELDLKSITVHGNRHTVESDEFIQKGLQGIGANKRTAEFTGGGAALGAIIGGIAAGGKGAAIGAAAGGGAGAATQILTKGKSIKIPVETVLPFRLEKPLQITDTQ